MAAFLKLGDIQGEATDANHNGWVIFDHMSAPIYRSVPQGAKDQQRTKGETTLGDINITRQLDKSSPKLAEACAKGIFFEEVEIHFCTDIKGKAEPYLKYVLKNALVTGYAFSGSSSGDPMPSEDFQLNYTEIEWNYVVLDPKTGDAKGTVPAKYNAAENG